MIKPRPHEDRRSDLLISGAISPLVHQRWEAGSDVESHGTKGQARTRAIATEREDRTSASELALNHRIARHGVDEDDTVVRKLGLDPPIDARPADCDRVTSSSCPDCCPRNDVPGATRLGGNNWDNATDGNLIGSTRQERYLDLTITTTGPSAGLVVDAIVVKGGNGYNLNRDPEVLPPRLSAPQGYLAPLVGEGRIPQISHWFACYRFDPTPQGSLVVNRDVLPPGGFPATPLPTQFKVKVHCDMLGFQPVTLTFGSGGGRAIQSTRGGAVIEGLAIGTTCTLEELSIDTFHRGQL